MSDEIQTTLIEQEMKESYLDYAMSVIISRALPDVRDGLKPVQRRILYAMKDLGVFYHKPYVKSARIIGEVIGKWHPHGDSSVYEALVRMTQNWVLRYPLVHGQGNFGSIDGHPPAAMRYCLVGDTLVLSNKGLVPIKSISNKIESKINLKILSYNGKLNKAVKFFNSGKHKIIGIETRKGYAIEGSYNHPVMVWSLGSNFKPFVSWKLLEEIKENDVVLLNRGFSLFSDENFSLIKYWPKSNFKNNVELPRIMNQNLAFLLGALTSEGSYYNKQILFSNKDLDFYTKVKKIIKSQFKGVKLYEKYLKGDCRQLSIYDQKVVQFFRNIGLSLDMSNEKEIPYSVLQSNCTIIKNFLVSLFECDGSVVYNIGKKHDGKSLVVYYGSKSKKLMDQLKTVLLNFSIVTSNYTVDKRSSCYKFTISSANNVINFYRKIGFFSIRKNNILKKINKLSKTRLSKKDFIPYLNDYLRFTYNCEFIDRNNFDCYNSLQKNYNHLMKILSKNDITLINWLLEKKYFFDQIKKVERFKTRKVVYSIKVDSKCHSFIANGFVNHNTEARLQKISSDMLKDLDKDAVDLTPNFDASLKEPVVLPSVLPNLLLNGSSGIAVGMATNIPPHNLNEVSNAIISYIDNPGIGIDELIGKLPGPDFPTGGIICGTSGIVNAYKTGKGKVIIRAKVDVDVEKNKIIVSEIPYAVNKSLLLQGIANLVRTKVIDGIKNLRDDSDRKGLSIVIEIKKDYNPELILNQLYKHSNLQTTFGINLLALVDKRPKLLNIKEIIEQFVLHRKIVIFRTTKFDLDKAEHKAHVLDGLKKALENIDSVVKLIKNADDVQVARIGLINQFFLSEIQANAILDMKLQRLTSLETKKIEEEFKLTLELINNLKKILSSESEIFRIIKEELIKLKTDFGDDRKSQFGEAIGDFERSDLIKKKDVVITISHIGYIKQIPLETYKQQHRGGKGIIGTTTSELDFIQHLFITNNHNYLLFFTKHGKVHWLKAYNVPSGGRYAKGKAMINLLRLDEGDFVTSVLPIKNFDHHISVMFATKKGILKKTLLKDYSNPRKGGIRAINVSEGDEVVNVVLTEPSKEIVLATYHGMCVHFKEGDIRNVGRSATGVRGVRLKQDDKLVGMEVCNPGASILTVTENGFGKRTSIDEYRLINRGGIGVLNIKVNEKNGKVVGIKSVFDDDEIMIVTEGGIIIRINAKDVSKIGRNTQGLRVIRLNSGDKVATVARVIKD